MTPTPSHVATDELIETLERRRTKSMAFEREFGLEGRTICPDDLDALFVTLSISEASALISALKENQRLLAWEQAHADAMSALRLQLRGAREALVEARAAIQDWGSYAGKYFQEKHDLAGDLAKIDAALQPQGEK